MNTRIGIIGFGEAGAAIGAGLTESGAGIAVFDVRIADSGIRRRIAAAGAVAADPLRTLVERSDVLICLTSASSALAVAREAIESLRPGQLYWDCNSTSPATKREIAALVSGTGAGFVDGAVMAAVPPRRHAVPIFLSGDGAEDLMAALDGLGMSLEIVGSEPGQASAIKMFRSLLIKGLEALIIECLLGARRFGVAERVLQSMKGSLPDDWTELAAYLVGRSLAHGRRRSAELDEVARTLAAVDVEPLLAAAGAERLSRFTGPDLPPGMEEGGNTPVPEAVMAWFLRGKDAADA